MENQFVWHYKSTLYIFFKATYFYIAQGIIFYFTKSCLSFFIVFCMFVWTLYHSAFVSPIVCLKEIYNIVIFYLSSCLLLIWDALFNCFRYKRIWQDVLKILSRVRLQDIKYNENNVTHVKTLHKLWLPWIISILVGKL